MCYYDSEKCILLFFVIALSPYHVLLAYATACFGLHGQISPIWILAFVIQLSCYLTKFQSNPIPRIHVECSTNIWATGTIMYMFWWSATCVCIDKSPFKSHGLKDTWMGCLANICIVFELGNKSSFWDNVYAVLSHRVQMYSSVNQIIIGSDYVVACRS